MKRPQNQSPWDYCGGTWRISSHQGQGTNRGHTWAGWDPNAKSGIQEGIPHFAQYLNSTGRGVGPSKPIPGGPWKDL